MPTHPFWGTVEEDWAGMTPNKEFVLPGFAKPVEVFLGEEPSDDDEEYTLSQAQLDEYAATFQSFLHEAPYLLADLKRQTFARYQQLYAAHYENPTRSGAPALHLYTAEQHFAYLQDVAYLCVTDEQTIRLSIHYDLDPEHGLELKFKANNLVEIGGMDET